MMFVDILYYCKSRGKSNWFLYFFFGFSICLGVQKRERQYKLYCNIWEKDGGLIVFLFRRSLPESISALKSASLEGNRFQFSRRIHRGSDGGEKVVPRPSCHVPRPPQAPAGTCGTWRG